MADDLSLLFKLRADNAQAKAVMADTRAAVTSLRGQFGKDLTQMQGVARSAFSDIGGNINQFVGQRVPLVGNAFVRLTENLRGLSSESPKTQTALTGIANSIQSIATQSNRGVPQITAFLTRFVQLGNQAERDRAAVEFFGASLGAKLIPELEKTGASMAALSTESAAAGGALRAMAHPVGLIVVAVTAAAIGVGLLAKELFNVSKRAAEFQGRMQDLSQQTGLAVETLSALEIAAATTGGSLNTITQALVQFQRRLDESLDPLSKTAAEFKDLGIQAGDTETALRQAFSALSRMPEGFQQTNAAAELFGARGGKQILALIKETNGDIDELITRARELGILIDGDAARAADKFNDELALLNFQIRSLSVEIGRDLIPILADTVRNFAELLRVSKPLLQIISTIAGAPLRNLTNGLRGLGFIVQALTGDYLGLAESIRKVNEEEAKRKTIPAQTTEGPQPVALPGQPSRQQQTAEAARLADDLVTITKRRVANEAQALNELFEVGRRNREQQARETIDLNRQVLRSEQSRLDAEIDALNERFRLIARDRLSRREIVDAEQEINKQVSKLQQERLDKEAQFERESSAIRAKARKERADSERNEAANQADRLVAEFENQIKRLQAAIDLGVSPEVEQETLTQIEQLERAKVEARIEGLEEQKRIGFLTVEEQKDLNRQLQQAQQEADHLDEEQQQRRLARARATAERIRDIKLGELDTLLQIEALRAERLIATNIALAAARVQSEEATAQKILAIRLSLIDSETEATRARLDAARTIADVDERARTEAELNNQLKILGEQRVTILADGNREIDDARQDDLDNERRYARELLSIRQRINDIQREAARTVIDLMILSHARRRDIIRAQAELDVQEETDRHQRELDSIRQQEIENRSSQQTQEEKLEVEKELNRQREAEAERHRLEMERIKTQQRQDEKRADPLGRIELDTESLEEFARVLEDSVVPLSDILANSFHQVADAIGQVVANWVLLGETGPAVMRKILAQALASIAAEAAVNAIKELALGFATLFFNPAESAAHFTAAALWGSIGGVAAAAGRSVAGDLFKPKSSGAGTSAGGSQDRGQLNPLTLNRNQPQPERRIVLQIQSNDSHIVKVVGADIRKAGTLRELVLNDGDF